MPQNVSVEHLFARIGRNIAYYRKQNNLTQEELGSYLGIGQSVISRYEKSRKKPQIKTLQKICNYFEISMESLLSVDYLDEEVIKSLGIKAPIQKCTNRRYYCYYICDRINESSDPDFEFQVFASYSPYEAKGVLRLPEDCLDCNVSMDETFTYLFSQDCSRDFFFLLTFCHHREKPLMKYLGGAGIVQQARFGQGISFGYCVICKEKLNNAQIADFQRYIHNSNTDIKTHQFFPSSNEQKANIDKLVSEWLKQHDLLTYNDEAKHK